MLNTKNWVQLGLVVAAFVIFCPRSSAQSISCSSDDGHRRYCPADTRGGVRILKQRSESPCNQGYSWGFDRGGVWVDRGCRADFVVDAYQNQGYGGQGFNGGGATSISCSSDDGRRHYCPAGSRGRVRLVQQRSESPCREGYSWGSDDRGVWVDHGCRADFAVGGGGSWGGGGNGNWNHDGNGYQGGGRDQFVSCSSDDMHRHYCPADTRRGGVQLVKQRSDSACRQGYSWGYDRSGIWVDHGCRADFQVVR